MNYNTLFGIFVVILVSMLKLTMANEQFGNIFKVGGRRIISVNANCPKGQAADSRGHCRDIY